MCAVLWRRAIIAHCGPSLIRCPVSAFPASGGDTARRGAGHFAFQSVKRIGISKKLRFTIFARDGYTCRYCGRQSDVVPLVVDHLIPVAGGGTSDPENLITACQDCNQGKAARTLEQAVPTETDRLRLAQERAEQQRAAESARAAMEARRWFFQQTVNCWCEIRGTKEADTATVRVMAAYAQELDFITVAGWIEKAHAKMPRASDQDIGRYVSGIRRITLADAAAAGASNG